MALRERELGRLFRSFVLSLSAPAVAGAWVACSPSDPPADAGSDATASDSAADASDGGLLFGDTSTIDSYVTWCDAGPPEFVTIASNTCNTILYVPCGLPSGDYAFDASTGPNQINRCDQICKGYNAFSCEVLTYGQVDLLMAALDASVDAGNDSGGAVDAQDPNAIPAPTDPQYVSCDCYGGGRRPVGLRARRRRPAPPVGEHLAMMAHLEAASVPAFLRMREELAALGAPRALLRRIDRAVRDERRHARVVARLARHFGGVVEAPRVRRFRPRSAEAIARENVVEGCVRETYGALVATWQATNAKDEHIRRAMERIAVDEVRHAAISASAAAFLATKLDARARARVERARRKAIDDLRESARHAPHPDLVGVAGLPSATQSHRLLEALETSVWA